MLHGIFCIVLKMNCLAVITALILLPIKFVLQKIGFPRRIMFFLWAVIAFRFVCPASLSSELSLFNTSDLLRGTESMDMVQSADKTVYHEISEAKTAMADVATNGEAESIFAFVWLGGVFVVLLRGTVSFAALKRKLRFAVLAEENIYMADGIQSSFVLGVFRPKIYVAGGVTDEDMFYIVMHEKMHIKRADHIFKIIAYAVLAVHWFNPISWVLFKIFADDMELACDESVLNKIGFANRRAYLSALLNSAVNGSKTMLVYNTCFSVNTTKKRIKNIIRLEKKSKLLSVVAVLFCTIFSVVLGTDAAELDGGVEAIIMTESDSEIPQITFSPLAKGDKNAFEWAAEVNENTEISDEENPKTGNVQAFGIYEDSKEKDFETQISEGKRANPVFGEAVDLSESYIAANYSVENGLGGSYLVKCDEGGTVSLYFNINTEAYISVAFYNSKTKEEVETFGILAGSETVHIFEGFDKGVIYSIEVKGHTKNDWQIEGTYIIY